jgi:ATP-dependent helicase/nuclease subunit A
MTDSSVKNAVTERNDEARSRIVGLAEGSLSETIYAGAGAGTGKTQALVERIANLFTIGGVKPENIAAVTFTVAAASELKQRVREELEKRLDALQTSGSTESKAPLATALDSLDLAFIGTIHSFAQSLLRERPLAVGLPPVFELHDEVQGDTRFEEEWSEWLDAELENSELADAVINAQRLGLSQPLGSLRDLAKEFHSNYDLVARIGKFPSPNQVIGPRDILESVLSDLNSAYALRGYCTADDDKLVSNLETGTAMVISWIDEALEFDSEEECILALTQLPKLTQPGGQKGNWAPLPDGESSLEEVRTLLKTAQATIESGRQGLGQTTIIPLVNAVSRMVLGYAAKRRNEGVLEFQDLLVLSCELLESNEDARKYFQARYTHVLIDEFQDTDPLQLKLAMRLADRSNTGGAPTPGALFVVGDGKQSIYRFRRADLTQLKVLVASLNAAELSLTDNFRSDPEVLSWVNQIFEPWMNGEDGQNDDKNQARYVSLTPGRKDYGESIQPRVMVAGEPVEGRVDVARAAESQDVAELALSVGRGEWELPDGKGGQRPSSYRDLAVLMPRRSVLSHLENAFFDHQVPYLLEGQAPIFDSQTIHELINNLVAIDDPTDQVAIIASLKSVAWGCSDQDLYAWSKSSKPNRKFEYGRERPDPNNFIEGSSERKVASALSGLAEFHDMRQKFSTPYLIENFVRDRRLREVAALSNPEGDRERLIDLFIEMARKLQRSGTGSLREFVRWISRQAELDVKFNEGALSSSEENAVRVMTVHAAKGLEFPIVALIGLQVTAGAPKGSSISREENGKPVVSVKLGSTKLGLATADYKQKAEESKAAETAENVRLAYVGATRAREHLMVSVHRTAKDNKSVAALISKHNETATQSVPFTVPSSSGKGSSDLDVTPNRNDEPYSLDLRNRWNNDHKQSIIAAKQRGYVTPSQLADHTMFEAPKPEDNMESTERNASERGRGGTNFGSAVHAVLQDIDFENRLELNDLVAAAIEAHGVEGGASEVTQSVNNVMSTPTMLKATNANSWREAWVAAEVEDGSEVEGSVDLIIRNEDDSMTIVDYKTDRVVGEWLEERAKGYEPQLAGYALVLEKLGMTVRDAVLIFANGNTDGSAREYFVDDLDAAKEFARAKIRQEFR